MLKPLNAINWKNFILEIPWLIIQKFTVEINTIKKNLIILWKKLKFKQIKVRIKILTSKLNKEK